MMNHARVKALKGDGKTVSKKAIKSGRASGNITPKSSPMASLLTSPTQSNTHSRAQSDDSADDDSDFEVDMMASVHSASSLGDADDEGTVTLDTNALLENIQDHKRNNNEVREEYLLAFIKVLRTKYSEDTHLWLDDAATELTDAFLRGANRAESPQERLLNLQSFCLTVGCVEDMEIFDGAQKALKQIILEDDDDDCRVWAMYSLSMAVLYAGGLEEAALEVMEYFIDIVQTDGDSIEAQDNAVLVAAALTSWGFVASHVEDYSDYAEAAMDAFVDQLDSTDTEIQSDASRCIALTFESSRSHEEDTGKPFQLPYDPQKLAGRLTELAKLSAKSISKKDRRELRESLLSVVTSLERGLGPFYSEARYVLEPGQTAPAEQMTADGDYEYGYRYKLRLGGRMAVVDSWSLYSRVLMMKTIFRSGLEKHVLVNPVVTECLDDADWAQNYAPAASEKRKKK